MRALVEAFRAAWLTADDLGMVGHRIEAGLEAVQPLIEDAVRSVAPSGMELRHDGTEDPLAAAYVAGVGDALMAVTEAFRDGIRSE